MGKEDTLFFRNVRDCVADETLLTAVKCNEELKRRIPKVISCLHFHVKFSNTCVKENVRCFDDFQDIQEDTSNCHRLKHFDVGVKDGCTLFLKKAYRNATVQLPESFLNLHGVALSLQTSFESGRKRQRAATGFQFSLGLLQ
jgi:hypothetical protein